MAKKKRNSASKTKKGAKSKQSSKRVSSKGSSKKRPGADTRKPKFEVEEKKKEPEVHVEHTPIFIKEDHRDALEEPPRFYDLESDEIPDVYDTTKKHDAKTDQEFKRIINDIEARSIESKQAQGQTQLHSHYTQRAKPGIQHQHYHRSRSQEKKAKVIAAALVGAVLVVVIALLAYYFFEPEEQYITGGVCFYNIQTYKEGEREKEFIELPGTECTSTKECEDLLREQRFPEKDIKGMDLKCSRSD